MHAFNRTLVILLALLALLAFSVTWLMAAPAGQFHQGAMACEACHLAGKTVTQEQSHLLLASQEKLCGKCHQATAQVSHPSGFLPRIKLPAGYPVDWKGDLTCSTCHEVHGSNRGLMRNDRRGRALCVSCHDASFFTRMRDQGASLMDSGHLDASTTAAKASLDTYSRQCMECHGGQGDSKAPTIDRNMVVRHGTSSLNHPIGANYVTATKFGGYRPVATISKKILLPGGLVSCVSCHEGFTANHGRVVKAERGAGLCYECHDL